MITVKLYGLMRVETGIKSLPVEAEDLKTVYLRLEEAGLERQALQGCCVLVNGEAAPKRRKLADGDVVQLLPPVAGG